MLDAQTYDWSKFEIVFYYDQTINDVFRSWVTKSGLESFLLEKANFQTEAEISGDFNDIVEKGDRYRWEWRQNFVLEGEVLNVKEDVISSE